MGGSTSDVVDLGVGNNIVVANISFVTWLCMNDLHGHVLLLGKDGIVGLELVLLEILGSLGRADLDVELACQLIYPSISCSLPRGYRWIG